MITIVPNVADAVEPVAVRAAVAGFETKANRPAEIEMRETHISWLFLGEERAFKLKKPLVLDFLDYGSPQRRREMCLAEVRLNARLAPTVYLGVRAIVDSPDGLVIADAGDQRAVDYLVEMRRYDERQTLAAAVARGDAGPRDVAGVGRMLARFHTDCPAVTDGVGATAVLAEIERNLLELLAQVDSAADRTRVLTLGRFLRAFISSHDDALDDRAAAGRTREVHGDLRAEHVVLRPAVNIVDCVEFDLGMRTLDVVDDLAFLVMDLAALGAESLARELVEAYRAAGGDCGDDALISFYAVHRALIRAKVQFVRARQLPAQSRAGAEAIATAQSLLAVAERCSWRARGPLILVACGVPASGKSHLAQTLSARAGMPVISSDVVRKELAGLEPRERAPADVYSSEFNRRTYAELGRRANVVLEDPGGAVLVDATFRNRNDRVAFRKALGADWPTVFVECLAPADVLAQRATKRERDPERVSDATAEIVERERHGWEPLDEVPADTHIQLRSDRYEEAVVADLTAVLDVRMGTLRAPC